MTQSPFGPLAVLVDPTAGSGVVAEGVPALRAALDRSGLAHTITIASDADHLPGLASAAVDGGVRYLAVAGDDRSIQRVVTGLFGHGGSPVEPLVLAVVPAGTDCDLVRSFGLPTDVDGAVSHLLGDATYDLDLMKISVTAGGERTIRYATNLAAVGFHAAAGGNLPPARGGVRRFLGFWRAYLRSGVRDVHVEADAKARDLRAWSLIVGNGQFGQGGLRLSPRSFPGDGVLEALVFTGPRSDAYRLLPRIFRHGDHVPDPGIVELKARLTFQIRADRAMPVVADGETIGTTPVTFQLLPNAVRLKL